MTQQTRELAIGQPDAKARTVPVVLSTETPVDRGDFVEVLDHSTWASIDLSRAPLPLIESHDQRQLPIGRVDGLRLEGRKLRGIARFGTSQRAQEVFQDVLDGTVRSVSIAYEYTGNPTRQGDGALRFPFRPLEVSAVSVPADPAAGFFRSYPMTIDETVEPITTLTRSQRRAIRADEDGERSAVEMERLRVTEIDGMCNSFNIEADDRMRMLRDGVSVSDAKKFILAQLEARSKSVQSLSGYTPADWYETNPQAREFSISRAIMAAASGDWRKAGYEREVSAEIGRRSGRDTSGLFIPVGALAPQRRDGYSTLTTAAGGAVVATDLLGGSFIDVLRPRCRVLQLGATVLSGLVGNVDIPRRTAAGPAQWITEGQSLTQGQGAFDVVSLRPRTVGSITTISRNLLMQGTPDAEMLVRADMVAGLAAAIDLAAIKGTGAAGQPLGILNQAGIGSVAGGTDGAAITYDHLIELAGVVAVANADGPAQGYLLNPQTITALLKLKTTQGAYLVPVGASNGETVAPAGGGFAPGSDRPAFTALGFPVAASSNVPSDLTKGAGTNLSAAIFGNWADLLIGEWGVLEVLPNAYASGAYEAGAVQIRAMQTIDIAVRHAQSFAAMKDAITS
ncbi:phage major capsid protein [Thiomonas bhubaneswarensis]|uniref:Phage major capsid protein, HK97 family n=1 Tax=Thiomonas bhubaneswarensis TaxID=339866 RepID=A0A0K6I524_9BURK|nr:phage major capsid protein [Thiomonas bhubaneswarensis]CUA98225.1 phage major capsid protein, HK97 family [Thiomonas bhubaneswarensis]